MDIRRLAPAPSASRITMHALFCIDSESDNPVFIFNFAIYGGTLCLATRQLDILRSWMEKLATANTRLDRIDCKKVINNVSRISPCMYYM